MSRDAQLAAVLELRQYQPSQESAGPESPFWTADEQQLSTAMRRDTAGETANNQNKNTGSSSTKLPPQI